MLTRSPALWNNDHIIPSKVYNLRLGAQLAPVLQTESQADTNAKTSSSMPNIDNSATWPQPGSTLYYALLHCSDSEVARAHTSLELMRVVSEVLADVSEPSVAEQKVHWWHEELDRLGKLQARHPACKQFQQARLASTDQTQETSRPAANLKKEAAALLQILSSNSNERFANANDESAFAERINDDYRARINLLCSAVQFPAPPPETLIESFTDPLIQGFGLSHRLRRFRELHSAGSMVWPESLYQQHDLQPETVYEPANKDALAALQAQVVASAGNALSEGLDGLWRHLQVGTSQRQAALVIVTAASLRLAQIRQWQKKPPDLLREYRGLTPFAKSLVMWKTKRKFAKVAIA